MVPFVAKVGTFVQLKTLVEFPGAWTQLEQETSYEIQNLPSSLHQHDMVNKGRNLASCILPS